MTSLSLLNNQELENRLKVLVTQERRLLSTVLEHIKEIYQRRLYLERGYSSLYDYLCKEFEYSGSAAMRRLEAARLLIEVPGISEKIREGSLNLSQIGELSRAVKEKEQTSGEKISFEQKDKLLETIVGKTLQETQKELARALDIKLKEPERQRVQKDSSIHLSLTFSQHQYTQLMKSKDIGAHLLSDHSTASVIEMLATRFLDSKGFRNSIPEPTPIFRSTFTG